MIKLERILLFLTAFFLPTQLGKHFWPQFSFIYSLPIDYLSPTIYFWDLQVILLIVIFLANRPKVNKTALNIFLIFILTQILSLVPFSSTSLNLGAGVVRLEQYLIAGLFGIYLASKHLNQIKRILFWALAGALLGQSFLAVFQFFKEGTLGLWVLGERTFSLSSPGIAKFDFYGREFLRPYGTFPHPNVLAAFLIIAVILLLYLKFSNSLSRVFFKASSFLAGLTILLTVSRTAIFAGLVSAFWLLGKKGRLLLFLIVILLLPILYTRFSAAFNFDNLSILRREELSVVSFKIFLSSPGIGIGLNNFIPKAADQLLIGPNRFLQPVHNIFLLTLAETGIVGFLGLVLLVSSAIKKLSIIWVVIIFLGMFDHFFLTLPQGYRLLFLIWGISLSAVQYPSEKLT